MLVVDGLYVKTIFCEYINDVDIECERFISNLTQNVKVVKIEDTIVSPNSDSISSVGIVRKLWFKEIVCENNVDRLLSSIRDRYFLSIHIHTVEHTVFIDKRFTISYESYDSYISPNLSHIRSMLDTIRHEMNLVLNRNEFDAILVQINQFISNKIKDSKERLSV